MLENLGADDQVVVAVEVVCQGAHRAERADRLRDVLDCVLGDVEAPCIDVVPPQRFDEEPDRAAGVEDGSRCELGHDEVRDLTEVALPQRLAVSIRRGGLVAVGAATVPLVVLRSVLRGEVVDVRGFHERGTLGDRSTPGLATM